METYSVTYFKTASEDVEEGIMQVSGGVKLLTARSMTPFLPLRTKPFRKTSTSWSS